MKILVCIKQVPDMESHFEPDSDGTWFIQEDLAFRLNEYDEYAVEEAVRLKEQHGNAPDVTVLSVGPERCGEALKKALAMGCDRAVHVVDPDVSSKDPWQLASIIAAFAQDGGFDLVFTGMQSQDRGSAQVGVIFAELLGFACATTVVDLELNDGSITVRRELEGRLRAVLRLALPAVVTCQSGLNTPRYPTLPNIMKAKKKEVRLRPVTELLTEQPRTETVAVYPPARKQGGIVLEGDVAGMADELVAILKEKTTVVR